MTGTHSLHHIFKPCRRTHRPSREDTHENYFNCCSLSIGPYVYGLWVERIFQLHPPAAPNESAGHAVLCCRQRIAFCCVLFRCAGSWRTAAALWLPRTTCADSAGGGALQHPGVSPDACAGDHCSGSGGLCTVDTGLPAISRKLQGHLQREGCNAVMNCVVSSFASARSGEIPREHLITDSLYDRLLDEAGIGVNVELYQWWIANRRREQKNPLPGIRGEGGCSRNVL